MEERNVFGLEKDNRMYFTAEDMKANYGRGFWVGTICTALLMLVLFAGIGLFVH